MRLSVGKLQLAHPTFLSHDAADYDSKAIMIARLWEDTNEAVTILDEGIHPFL